METIGILKSYKGTADIKILGIFKREILNVSFPKITNPEILIRFIFYSIGLLQFKIVVSSS